MLKNMRILDKNIIISNHSIFEEFFSKNKKWILVNTVNCEWFMWKWIALEFKIRFPDYYNDYKEKCDKNIINVWKIDLYTNWLYKIISFPTKNLYKLWSKIERIIEWLDSLIYKVEEWIFDNEIIYIPKLWSLNWLLDWSKVFYILKDKLIKINNKKVKFVICEDSVIWKYEKEILENILNINLPSKYIEKIRENICKINRLRDLLKISWIWKKTYLEILNSTDIYKWWLFDNL